MLRRQPVLWVWLTVPMLGGSGAEDPREPEICEDFTAIIQSSADGFEALRGEQITRHEDPVGDTRVLWQCTRMLPGANACEIEWSRQTFTYQAFWHRQNLDAHAEVFEALEELLGVCGVQPRKRSDSGKSLWLRVDDTTDLDVVLAYNINRVRLSFARIGFQNP